MHQSCKLFFIILCTGCTLRLSTQREGVGPSAIDLNKDGDEEIKALDLARDSKFTVCWFSKLQRMTTTGYENSNPALFIFAGITGKDKFKIRVSYCVVEWMFFALVVK